MRGGDGYLSLRVRSRYSESKVSQLTAYYAGVPSVVSSIFVFLFFPDFPETVVWLSDEERALAVGRLVGLASTKYVLILSIG